MTWFSEKLSGIVLISLFSPVIHAFAGPGDMRVVDTVVFPTVMNENIKVPLNKENYKQY